MTTPNKIVWSGNVTPHATVQGGGAEQSGLLNPNFTQLHLATEVAAEYGGGLALGNEVELDYQQAA